MRALPLAARTAIVTMAAALGSWLTGWAIAEAFDLRGDVIVLATVLAVTTARVVARQKPHSLTERGVRLVTVPLVALGAGETGTLLLHHRWIGGAVFCLVMALTVWVRRFGRGWTSLGSMTALPFVVLLVAPVAPAPGHEHTLWPALVAVVALAWVGLLQQLAWKTGFVPVPAKAPDAPPPRPATGMRASTKMAVQLGLGLAISYALGTWWFPEHWPWMVLSCYVVASGTAGRGDVLHRGLLRLAGAAAGTIGATLLATAFTTGNKWALVVMFAVMALAVWLRPRNYAYWAAGVTAMLALLHGYYGEHGADLLLERLAGVVLGATIGVAVAWFVLPVRSRDAFRRRFADALAALSAYLAAVRTMPEDQAATAAAFERYRHATAQFGLLEPAYRAHRRTLARRSPNHPLDLLADLSRIGLALAGAHALPADVRAAHRDTLGGWARQVGAVRRRMKGAEPLADPPAPTGIMQIDAVSEALSVLDTDFARALWFELGGS